jgi:response regulator RpfG family c-di-GMP phosphodiesterase
MIMANPTVLFADRDSHRRMGQLLEVAGFDVATCEIDAVHDSAGQLHPLVIVVDAQLLVGPNAGVLDALKRSDTANIPVLLTSKGNANHLGQGPTIKVFSRPVNREKLFLAISAYDFRDSGLVQPEAI